MLLNLLPNVGDIKSLKLQRVLKEELSFSDEEQQALKFNTDPRSGSVKWDNAAEETMEDKEIEVCKTNFGVIAALLDDLDKQSKLMESHIELWDMFHPEGGDDGKAD
jgi:hypothetical protein